MKEGVSRAPVACHPEVFGRSIVDIYDVNYLSICFFFKKGNIHNANIFIYFFVALGSTSSIL